LAQLSNRLQLLTGGHRDAPERLQTMRHAIVWSYDLLSHEEQRLFRRLSVFVGGFTLEGAMAVGAEKSVLDLLTSLVDKSLVQHRAQPDVETRFLMLETIREFGLEQLNANGEAEAVRDAHAAAFLTQAEEAVPYYYTAELPARMDKIEAELANCYAALEWADTRDDAETVARLVGALWRVWLGRGYSNDSRRWLDRSLAIRDAVSPPVVIELLRHAASFYVSLVDDEKQAQAIVLELLARAEGIGDEYGLYWGHHYLGLIAERRSEFQAARDQYNQALALAPRVQHPTNELAWAVHALARIDFHQGDLEAAATGLINALAHHRRTSSPYGDQSVKADLARVRFAQGNIRDAAALWAEQLALAWENRIKRRVSHALVGLAMAAVATNHDREAARLLGAIDALRLRSGALLEVDVRTEAVQATTEARRALGEEEFEAAFVAGQELSLDEATQEALAVARAIAEGALPLVSDASVHGLTPHELAVLRLLVEGLSDKEIGEALGINRRTASKHVEIIRGKLAVPSRTAAATYATRHGLI
jgi:DNA-binding NarL/FixJ family response regulator